MKNDVIALGELLIDFTQNGISQAGNWMMEANPGGAPCNVLAMLTKLGHNQILFCLMNTILLWLLFTQPRMATGIFLFTAKLALMLF